MQVEKLRTVREVMKTSGQEFDSALGGASKLVNSFGEIYTAAVTADNGVAASLEIPIVPWSQQSSINPEKKYALQGAVMTCTPVTGYFELFDRRQVRITSAKILQRERQLNEKNDSIEGFRVLLSRSFGFFDKFFFYDLIQYKGANTFTSVRYAYFVSFWKLMFYQFAITVDFINRGANDFTSKVFETCQQPPYPS